MLTEAERPAVVVGSGADESATWAALVRIADALGAPVWQESFGARAGFPHDHPRFAGHLPADRQRLRAALDQYDVVLVVGAPAFRQYAYAPGLLYETGTRVAVVTDDVEEAHRSRAEVVLLAPVAGACVELARMLPARAASDPASPTEPLPVPEPHNPLRPGYVFAELARRLQRDAVVIEETPSSRPEMLARLPAREPLGWVSPAMGGLGFAFPAAVGLRMALPKRPVVAVVGDGSSLYSIQALWSAAHYEVGTLFVVLANGGYAVMDRLAEREGGSPRWPQFREIDFVGLAQSFGCPARRVATPDDVQDVFDEVVPDLADRAEPLLLEVAVAPDETFAP